MTAKRKWTRFNWAREYRKHCPHATDPFSRHVRLIATEELKRGPARKVLESSGYEPDHWSHSMQWTVKMLWDARAKLAKAQATIAKLREKP